MRAGFAFKDRNFARARAAVRFRRTASGRAKWRGGHLAWAYLLLDDPALIERALPLLSNAAIAPWLASYAVAEACVLAASSDRANQRVLQARDLLTAIERERPDRQDAAYTALAKGLCAAVEGDVGAAIRYRDVAKSLGATAAPLRVLERRFPSP